ncbi:MAG: hypothetical protein AABZ47_11295 [Planctomycetota bacterium]
MTTSRSLRITPRPDHTKTDPPRKIAKEFHKLWNLGYHSNLARGNVHPKIAQQRARHSTITLTMDRYSHTKGEQLADALFALPDLTPEPCEKEAALAT